MKESLFLTLTLPQRSMAATYRVIEKFCIIPKGPFKQQKRDSLSLRSFNNIHCPIYSSERLLRFKLLSEVDSSGGSGGPR
jgi:hypothetical protein